MDNPILTDKQMEPAVAGREPGAARPGRQSGEMEGSVVTTVLDLRPPGLLAARSAQEILRHRHQLHSPG